MSRASTPGHSRRGSATTSQRVPSTGQARTTSGGVSSTPSLSTRMQASASGPSSSSATVPRVGSPSPAVTAQPQATQQQRDVSKLIGAKVRLTLVGGAEGERAVEGSVWCYDSTTGVVVLETPSVPSGAVKAAAAAGNGKAKLDYRLVKVNQVKAIDVLSPSSFNVASPGSVADGTDPTTNGVDSILAPLRPVNIAAVKAREAKAIKAEDASRARIGVGVSRWGQEIFDALGRTLPVRWHEASIVIMDELLLSPPLYRPEDVRAGVGGHGRLERVRQVLEGERARLLRTEEGKKWEAEAA